MRWGHHLLLAFALVAAAGCHGSRWAKRDADYRHKYPEHTTVLTKTIKQSIDARHVRDKSGAYVSLAGREAPFAGGFDVGKFRYTEPWLEQRIGFSGLVHEAGKRPVSAGVLASSRVQTPSRLAPFVGVGGYLGWAGGSMREERLTDDDDDLATQLIFDTKHEFVVAAFPEVGAHFWIDHRRRVTVSASYWFTNQDYNEDFLFFSVGFSWFGDYYQDYRVQSEEPYFPPEILEFEFPAPVAEPPADSPYAHLLVEQPSSIEASPSDAPPPAPEPPTEE